MPYLVGQNTICTSGQGNGWFAQPKTSETSTNKIIPYMNSFRLCILFLP